MSLYIMTPVLSIKSTVFISKVIMSIVIMLDRLKKLAKDKNCSLPLPDLRAQKKRFQIRPPGGHLLHDDRHLQHNSPLATHSHLLLLGSRYTLNQGILKGEV